MGDKKENPISVYAVVSQIGFMVITPLLLFIWGGAWLVNKFNLPSFLTIIFVLMGIFTMISSVGTYLKKLIKKYDDSKSKEKEMSPLHHDQKDHDW